MLYREEGIIIRSTDYGESNKIIVLFTPTYGKISLMARGAKKSKSRLFAAIQLFTHGEYMYYQSRAGQMGTLNQAEILANHHLLRDDLHMTAYSAYLVELTDRLIGEQEGGAYLFSQLQAGLDTIEQGKDMQIIARIYELHMLAAAGYAPSFRQCVVCEEEANEPVLSIAQGGAVCRKCRHGASDIQRVSDATFKLLQLFQRFDLRRLGSINVSQQTKTELKQILYDLMDCHVHTQWKSRNFIDQMHKYEL